MKWNFKGNGDETSPKKTKNIYARGADDGFWLGLYFSVLFGVTVVSLSLQIGRASCRERVSLAV